MPLASLRQNLVSSLANQLVQAAVLSIAGFWAARMLGPEGQGRLATILALGTLAAAVGHLALPFGSTYMVSSNSASASTVRANALLFIVVAGTVGTLSVWFVAPPLVAATRLALEAADVRWVAFLLIPSLLMEFGASLLAGLRRFRELAIVNVAVSALFLVALAVALRPNAAQVGVAAAVFCGYRGLRGVVLLLLAKQPEERHGPDVGVFKATLKYGLQGHAGTLLQIGVYRLDLLILSALAGASAVGIYSVAVVFAEAVGHLSQSAARVILPEVAARGEDGRHAMAARLLRQTLWASVTCALLLAASASPLVRVLVGQEYSESVRPLWMLLPGVVALAGTRVATQALAGAGKPWVATVAAGFALVLTVVLDVLWIPRWGVLGAAGASSVTYIAQFLLLLWLLRRFLGVAVRDAVAFRPNDFRVLLNLRGLFAGG